MKQIVSIIRRSEQGITRPFQCRADDGSIYWCKGLQQKIDGLRREWFCGTFAKELRLPICEFDALDCPIELYEEWLSLSGEAHCAHDTFITRQMHVVFGSKHVEQINDLRCIEQLIRKTDNETLLRALFFDKLIHNTDRTFRNSNILLPMGMSDSFYLIDHGNAFNCEYSRGEFLVSHIFAAAYEKVQSENRSRLFSSMVDAITGDLIDCIWNSMPNIWKDLDSKEYAISLEEVKTIVLNETESL